MSMDLANLYIKVDSSGVVTASKNLNDLTGNSQKAEKATDSVTKSFRNQIGVVQQLATAYGAYKIAQYIKEAILLAARYETLGVVMRVVGNNAGYSGREMESFAKGLEKTGISMLEARQSLTRMVQANLDLAKSSQLARVAQDAAVIGNINSSEAFQRLVYGIQSAQVEMLRTVGINVNFENSYQKVAKVTGRVVASFTEKEKAEIRMNTVMEAGVRIVGTYEAAMGTAGKQMASLERHLENLKVLFGQAFTPALAEIVETITGAVTDLNGNLSGEGKQAIEDWGNNFRLIIISIEVEIMRLGMFIDKIGGTLTQIKMLLSGPGMVLGLDDSTKNFDAALKQNQELEKRYKATEKAIEALAKKYNELEQAQTPAGKAATKAAQDKLEKLRMEAAKAKKVMEEKATLSKAEIKAIKDEEAAYKAMYDQLKFLSDDYYQYKINQFETERKQYIKATGDRALADQVYASKKKALDEDLYAFYFKDLDEANKKAAENIKKAADEYERLMNTIAPVTDRSYELAKAIETITAVFAAGTPEWQAAIDKVEEFYDALSQKDKLAGLQQAADEVAKQAQLYKDLGGLEDEYRAKKLEWIGLEADARFKAADEEVAKAKWVAEMVSRYRQEELEGVETKYDRDNKYTKDTITNIGKVLDAAQTMYEKDSSEYNRIAEWKKGVQIAELGMETAKNVALLSFMVAQNAAYGVAMAKKAANLTLTAAEAVLTQGTGDPYTAFARIAAMMAIVAGVMSMAGIAFGSKGGGGGSVSPSGPRSTVLGAEAGTGSESIQKSWELLQDTYDMEYIKLSGIYNEMKDLNKNITGLVTNIIRKGQGLPEVWTGSTARGLSGGFQKAMGSMTGQNSVGGIINSIFYDMPSAYLHGTSKVALQMNKLDFVGQWLNKTVITPLINKIIGGSSKTSQTGGGMGLNAISAGSLIGGGSVSGYTYADMYKKTDGGWFGKDKKKYWTEYAGMDESTSDLFTQVYKDISQTLVELSKGLGTDLNAAMNYVFGAVKINLLGMSAEDISKTLQAHFSAVGDNAVEALFGSLLKGYQQVGEGLLETAVRIMVDKEVILETLRMTNQAFVGSTQEIIAFSEALIEMAGGLDKLTEAAATYYDKFFSDKEKQLRLQGQLTEALGSINMILPETRQGYRDLVEGLDLTTESGQGAYVSLLMMSDSANKYYDELIAAQDAAQDALIAAQEKYYDELIAAQDNLIVAQEKVVSEFQGYVDKLKAARESMKLEGAIEPLTSLSARTVLEQIKVGDYSGIASLDVSRVSSTAGFATREDYQRNFFDTLTALSEAERLTSNQLSIEQQSLNVLQSQLEVLKTIAATIAQSSTAAPVDRNSAYLTKYPDVAADAYYGTHPYEHYLQHGQAEGRSYASGGIASGPDSGYGATLHGTELIISPNTKFPATVRGGDNVILIEEVRALRAEIKAGNFQMAKNTGKMARVMDNIDQEMNTDGLLTRTA